MVNQSVHGYKSGLRQLETQIFLSFDCPETVDFTAVDKVIQKIYGLQIDEWSTETSRPHSTAETFSERAMIIARSILQDARLPIFDLGVILNTDRSEENTQKWHIQIAIPAIDHVSLKLLIKAYRSALRVLRQCIYMPQEPLNLSAIQSAISKKTVQPIRARVVAGISTTHILKAAYDLDIPFRHLGSGLYQLGWGSRARLIDRSSVESDSAFGSKVSQNKAWTSTLTRSAGLPSPTHIYLPIHLNRHNRQR
ncbi:hypothetical protein BOW53_14300 [Solemya pervernicosa gill symbiont]|uniref:Uncharacterized protein n=1 Tax=Solemya pervernicosa gill symbiont TaxID=642797 RepID=A0A1T2L120_9GAMM|nr:hypothetical protein [Solemya pervernicosa gill symbiont]OOZ38764.1 hypothetical protein BOW53_14300 [Solemya pervernicosa gill symbiont]